MHTRIPEMRDPSKWKFPKRGIPQFRNSKTRESIHFCSFLQEISSFYKCFSVLNWDSQFQNFIEEFQCLQCMSNIGLLITFHTATSGAICWPSSQAIPRFGNFYFEGSLVLEISILRDPSFWKFPFWGIPHFRNFGTGMKQTGFFGGFCPFFVLFFAFSPIICMWNALFAKIIVPFDIL